MSCAHLVAAAGLVLLCGCAAQRPAAEPTTLKTGRPGFLVSCHGPGLDWGVCYAAAAAKCPGGFAIDDRELSSADGQVFRRLTFACR